MQLIRSPLRKQSLPVPQSTRSAPASADGVAVSNFVAPTGQMIPAVWHREFKISGFIGEPGQKDRLTFSSLARQIEKRTK